MAKVITIRISDNDYRDMVDHFVNRAGQGKPLVGVEVVLDNQTRVAIEDGRKAKTRPGRTVTCREADQIASDTFFPSYSSSRYGVTEWSKAARFLAAHGFTAKQIEAILYSKWMRWAADAANSNDGKASHLRAYIKAMHGDEFREAAKMVKEGK